MPTISVTIPAGAVTTKLGTVALVWWHAKHDRDIPLPVTPAALAAAQEMVRDYLRAVYQQATVNDAQTTAQVAVTAATTQAITDAGSIT